MYRHPEALSSIFYIFFIFFQGVFRWPFHGAPIKNTLASHLNFEIYRLLSHRLPPVIQGFRMGFLCFFTIIPFRMGEGCTERLHREDKSFHKRKGDAGSAKYSESTGWIVRHEKNSCIPKPYLLVFSYVYSFRCLKYIKRRFLWIY